MQFFMRHWSLRWFW